MTIRPVLGCLAVAAALVLGGPSALSGSAGPAVGTTRVPDPRTGAVPRPEVGRDTERRRRGSPPGGVDREFGLAFGPPGKRPAFQAGDLETERAWSTIKVPIALAVLEHAGGPDRLTDLQRSQIELALRESDNAAAAALFSYLGPYPEAARLTSEVLRDAGDRSTRVAEAGADQFLGYGVTDWSLKAQYTLLSALARGCVGDRASRRYVLDQMGSVRSDTWGLGSAGLPARWKGGWGPGPDERYLLRQMGLVDVHGRTLVVVLAVRAADGSSETAQRLATRLARWAVKTGNTLARKPKPC